MSHRVDDLGKANGHVKVDILNELDELEKLDELDVLRATPATRLNTKKRPSNATTSADRG